MISIRQVLLTIRQNLFHLKLYVVHCIDQRTIYLYILNHPPQNIGYTIALLRFDAASNVNKAPSIKCPRLECRICIMDEWEILFDLVYLQTDNALSKLLMCGYNLGWLKLT